jgi:hypothetical protein
MRDAASNREPCLLDYSDVVVFCYRSTLSLPFLIAIVGHRSRIPFGTSDRHMAGMQDAAFTPELASLLSVASVGLHCFQILNLMSACHELVS